MTQAPFGLEKLAAEFDGVSFGDTRLGERLNHIVTLLGASPGDSFPEQMEADSELEALYRFFANPKVTVARLLAPHLKQTHRRMRDHKVVRVLHDTTPFAFDGSRQGLGIIARGKNGFFAHTALAVAPDETLEPIGVLGLRPYIHKNTKDNRRKTVSQKKMDTRNTRRSQKESSRWEQLAIDVSAELPASVRAVHIMDQEADDYALFAELQKAGLSFVVRALPARLANEERLPVREILASKPARILRTIHLTPRSARKARISNQVERSERTADLKVRWGRITLRRGRYMQADAPELSLYAVHVFEPSPPEGEEPVEWMLFTSEVVTTLEQATAVLDHYRARWVIEEYFKALKTGCAIEKRQLTSFEGLTRALAVFVPMAWHLLLLRHMGRDPVSRPATSVFRPRQLALLNALLRKRKRLLPANPTARDAMLGIAALGGHIRNNGDPGWLVLGRGFTRFAEAEEVWLLAEKL
jgi:hypothetical protein